MDTQTVLLYVAPILPFVVLAIDQWLPKRLKKKGKLLVSSLILFVAWALVYYASDQGKAQLAQARRDNAALSEQLRHLRVQIQDQAADQAAAQDKEDRRSLLIAEGCIADPKLRRQAKALPKNWRRDVTEKLPVSDKATGFVNRAPQRRYEPLKP